MDEELKKELISILRAMKEGAPGAWQELVAQRSTYCLTLGIANLIVCLIAFVCIRIGISGFKRVHKENIAENEIFLALYGIMIGLSTFTILMTLTHAITYLAEGFAPLGRILEFIRD